jgi:putative membrane protein
MTSNLGRRVLKHGFVFTTTLLTCAALRADHNDQHGNKTEQFIRKAAMGGHMEVEMGQLAQQKGQSQAVKDLGATLVRDHTQANQKLEQLASSKNITFDKSWTETAAAAKTTADKASTDKALTSAEHGKEHAKHHQTLDKLRSQSGAEFDKEFVKLAIKDHKKDIAEFEKCRNDVTDADVKAFIDQTLPTLRNHLQMARSAARSVGVDEATIAADREDDNASATGAPAAGAVGTRGSDKPSSPASNPNTNPANKDRSSIENSERLNTVTDTDASGTIRQNAPAADIEANVVDRSVSASASANPDSTVLVTTEPEKKNKVFQKGDGKVLGLSTDKNDGKLLGIIPKPKKDEDKGVNAEVNVNTDSSSAGTSATTESGTRSDSDQK